VLWYGDKTERHMWGSPEDMKPEDRQLAKVRKRFKAMAMAVGMAMEPMDPDMWSTLPQGLLELIFARLPLHCIVQLRTLSKQWHANITLPAFQHAYRETGNSQRFAVVMDSERAKPKKVWAYDVMERRWNGLPLQYLPFTYLVAAGGGLLCFVKFNRRLLGRVIVCNPLTHEWRELPPPHEVKVMPRVFHIMVDPELKQYSIFCIGTYLTLSQCPVRFLCHQHHEQACMSLQLL